MGKQKKAFKNFKKNKSFQAKHIKRKKLEQQEKITQTVKDGKLIEEEFSDEDEQREQQNYLQYDKNPKKGKQEKYLFFIFYFQDLLQKKLKNFLNKFQKKILVTQKKF
jgi:hypothetical protein